VQRGKAERIETLERPPDAIERCFGLANMHDALGESERRIERSPRPAKHGVPMLGLGCDQCLWPFGAVTEQIGACIFQNVGDDRLLPVFDAVDCAIGKLGQRHGQGIDAVSLCAPLLGHRLCELTRWQCEMRLGWRTHRLAVEQKRSRPPPFVLDRHMVVEALGQIRDSRDLPRHGL
jgi:hypothetical protein